MNNATRMPPGHLQQAQAALAEAGIPYAVGTKALALAAHFYHQTPQVSQTDALRRERNRIQDELEIGSSQLLQERRKTRQLEQELAAVRQLPKTHQNKGEHQKVWGSWAVFKSKRRKWAAWLIALTIRCGFPSWRASKSVGQSSVPSR